MVTNSRVLSPLSNGGLSLLAFALLLPACRAPDATELVNKSAKALKSGDARAGLEYAQHAIEQHVGHDMAQQHQQHRRAVVHPEPQRDADQERGQAARHVAAGRGRGPVAERHPHALLGEQPALRQQAQAVAFDLLREVGGGYPTRIASALVGLLWLAVPLVRMGRRMIRADPRPITPESARFAAASTCLARSPGR